MWYRGCSLDSWQAYHRRPERRNLRGTLADELHVNLEVPGGQTYHLPRQPRLRRRRRPRGERHTPRHVEKALLLRDVLKGQVVFGQQPQDVQTSASTRHLQGGLCPEEELARHARPCDSCCRMCTSLLTAPRQPFPIQGFTDKVIGLENLGHPLAVPDAHSSRDCAGLSIQSLGVQYTWRLQKNLKEWPIYPKIENTGSTGCIIWAILEVQVPVDSYVVPFGYDLFSNWEL